MSSIQPQPSQNGVGDGLSSPEQDKLSSDDEGVRKHTSSSVSRTQPNPNWTPPTDVNDMGSVKQKIDFSDTTKQGHQLSTSPPLPRVDQKPKLAVSAPPSLNSSRTVVTTPPLGNDINTPAASVDTILSRLETVRSYTEDARSLYQQLQAHEEEPGTTEQMERVSLLINQLKQQELSYLQVLLKIMEDERIADGQLGEVEQMMNRNSLNYGEQEDEEDDEDEEEVEEGDGEEEEESDENGLGEGEGKGSNDSLSLRAEMMKGNEKTEDDGEEEELAKEFVDQQRELEALHEQRALLMKLQEQQSQLAVLQERQSQLLKLKREAEERLSEAEKQCDELGDVSLEYSREAESLNITDPGMEKEGAVSFSSEREKQLLTELEELKQKKKQAERLMGQLSTMKGESPQAPVAAQRHVGVPKPQDELVDARLQDMKSKMKQIDNARRKMKELQEMVGMLQGVASSSHKSPPKGDTRSKPQPRGSGAKKPKVPPVADNLDDSQDDEVIQLLADYERNIGKRQRELEAIKKQKEELKRVEEMLQDLQLMTESAKKRASASGRYANVEEEEEEEEVEPEDEQEVSRRLTVELGKQRELYEDLKRKTQQLKQLQQDIEKLSRVSDHESAMADTTIATWGGSSIASMLSTAMEDETRESTDPNLPQYQVDRHTPRHPRPLRRAYSPHDEQDSTIGKKIKLEPQSSGGMGTPTTKKAAAGPSHQTPSVSKRSAVWPTVIFSQSANKPSVGKVQTPPSFSRPKGSIPTPAPAPAPSVAVPNDYTLLLQQQLANSSAMCFQLMEHQSSLLQALNQKLDTLPHIQDQMIRLHEYHEHLQGYHEYLNNAYWQLMEHTKGQEVDEQGQEEEVGGDNDAEGEEDDNDEGQQGGKSVGSKDKKKQQSFIDDPLSSGILPPPHSFPLNHSLLNSPYQRPTNPHLQASPDTKRFRPFSRPPGYPYSLYGNAHVDPNYLPEVVQGAGFTQDQQTQCEGVGVTSTVPATATAAGTNPLEMVSTSSLPDKPDSDASGGVTVFDTLRDTVYSEVAALIATNENRPHFLVELFRELQQLNTDYLRQRALYSIQDLVTRFLKDEDVVEPESQEEAGEDDGVPVLTSEGNRSIPVPTKRANSQRFDYSEVVESASSISTPPVTDEPFASDTLGDTIIKMEKHAREPSNEIDLDTSLLDEEIKTIMTNIIPLLKQHLMEECSLELLDTIRTTVVNMVLTREDTKSVGDLGAVFTEQLITSLTTTINKHRGKMLKDCGEDLLVDVSEVLFNEIAFFRLIKDTKGTSRKDYYHSVTSGSQTTTDQESATNSPLRPAIDTLTLQALGSVISQTLQDESESLGNARDDELANKWEQLDQKLEEGNQKEEIEENISVEGGGVSPKKEDDTGEEVKEVDSVEDGYVHVSSGSAEPNTLLPATNGDPQITGSPPANEEA